jgi:hypothetical protein
LIASLPPAFVLPTAIPRNHPIDVESDFVIVCAYTGKEVV